MTFYSILFEDSDFNRAGEPSQEPHYFVDLNLDQIVGAITLGKQEYDLRPFFYMPLKDTDAINYRHEVMQDLEDESLFQHIKQFAREMHQMRQHLAQAEKLYYLHQKQSWFLDAVRIYCDAVTTLAEDLTPLNLKSRGLLAFQRYLNQYAASHTFTSLVATVERLKADLSTVQYSMHIRGNAVTVFKYENEPDYSIDVEETFAKFKQRAAKDHLAEFQSRVQMNHVEAKILEFVTQLFPDIFQRLHEFYESNRAYLDETLADFDREVQFYIAYLEYMRAMQRAGLEFCYPEISTTDKEVHCKAGFDLALARKLVREETPIVRNDFYLQDEERVIVVSGPNQGGKTTFARMFGQLHYLASIGCPVPGKEARLFLFDRLFTHFEKEEDIGDLRGKLQDELVRIHNILQQATPRSVIIINEIFTSTTAADASFLARQVLDRLLALDALCVCVTFIDELASLSEKTVSMVSTVVSHDPATRTFKIVRRPAEGLAYAITIAEKHGLTYQQIKDRLES